MAALKLLFSRIGASPPASSSDEAAAAPAGSALRVTLASGVTPLSPGCLSGSLTLLPVPFLPWGHTASPDRGFVKSRAHDRFSPGAEPRRTSPRLMVRLPSKLRGRFETTKNPVVRCGTLVLGRPGDGIFTYSAGRRLESENNPGKDQTGNRCTLVFAWLKTRNKQNECTTQCVHGRGPACVIAWKMVLRNTGV